MATIVETELAAYEHGRVPRELRRRQIVELAGELFAERGYAATSMAELARRAGVSKPVIYDLVGSKEELYRASCEEVAAEAAQVISAAVLEHDDPGARLRAGAIAGFRFAARHERAAAVLFSEGAGEFADEVGSLRRQRGELIGGLLADQAVRQGRTPDPLQLEAVAHALGGAFEAMALWWREHPEVDPERLADWLVELTRAGVGELGA